MAVAAALRQLLRAVVPERAHFARAWAIGPESACTKREIRRCTPPTTRVRRPRRAREVFAAASWGDLRRARFPAPVHPIPLLRMRAHSTFQGSRNLLRERDDGIVAVDPLRRKERTFPVDSVSAIRLTHREYGQQRSTRAH